MKTFRYLVVLFAGLAFVSGAHAQLFYDNSGLPRVVAAAQTTDEIADDTPFTGTQHVASFTFRYLNPNSGPVDAVVRFYNVNQSTGFVGNLVSTISVPSLAPGSQFVTVNLPTAQQFDWTATTGIYHLTNVTGGFVSVQFTSGTANSGWYEAGGASIDGFFDVTTGQFVTFQGDGTASFYLQISRTTQSSTLSSITVTPATVKGGTNSLAQITLTAPAPAGGLVVKLMSSKPRVATVPASVQIPAGAVSASVPIKTRHVRSSTILVVSASLNGTIRLSNLTVTP